MKLKLVLVLYILFAHESFSMTVEEARLFCRDWFTALTLGNRDVEIATKHLMDSFYTDDARMIDPNYKLPLIGKNQIRQYYRLVLQKYPNWNFRIEEIVERENGFVLHYVGNVPGVVETFRGVDIIDIHKENNGVYKIKNIIGVYDRAPFIEAENDSARD